MPTAPVSAQCAAVPNNPVLIYGSLYENDLVISIILSSTNRSNISAVFANSQCFFNVISDSCATYLNFSNLWTFCGFVGTDSDYVFTNTIIVNYIQLVPPLRGFQPHIISEFNFTVILVFQEDIGLVSNITTNDVTIVTSYVDTTGNLRQSFSQSPSRRITNTSTSGNAINADAAAIIVSVFFIVLFIISGIWMAHHRWPISRINPIVSDEESTAASVTQT